LIDAAGRAPGARLMQPRNNPVNKFFVPAGRAFAHGEFLLTDL
jgi:hypothetical protein